MQPTTLKYLKELKKNNNKPWFDKNRERYDVARKDFSDFIQGVIDSFGKKDPTIKHLLAKDCLYRINRDIRFSKDKTPYKVAFAASINKDGKKSMNSAGYYFHLEPGNSFIGGGIWMPEAPSLKKIRQEIDYNLEDFKKILKAPAFKKVYGSLSEDAEYRLSRVPKGYEPDNPAAEFLKFKSYIAGTSFDDADMLSGTLVKQTTAAFEALRPLVYFLNESMK